GIRDELVELGLGACEHQPAAAIGAGVGETDALRREGGGSIDRRTGHRAIGIALRENVADQTGGRAVQIKLVGFKRSDREHQCLPVMLMSLSSKTAISRPL